MSALGYPELRLELEIIELTNKIKTLNQAKVLIPESEATKINEHKKRLLTEYYACYYGDNVLPLVRTKFKENIH